MPSMHIDHFISTIHHQFKIWYPLLRILLSKLNIVQFSHLQFSPLWVPRKWHRRYPIHYNLPCKISMETTKQTSTQDRLVFIRWFMKMGNRFLSIYFSQKSFHKYKAQQLIWSICTGSQPSRELPGCNLKHALDVKSREKPKKEATWAW